MAELNFWIWFLGICGAVLLGGILTLVGYVIFDWLNMRQLKQKLPKLDNKLKLNPGKPVELNQEEVKQNERERLSKFREFEKLRKLADRESGVAKSSPSTTGTSGDAKRTILPSDVNSTDSGTKRSSKERTKLIKPTDLSE